MSTEKKIDQSEQSVTKLYGTLALGLTLIALAALMLVVMAPALCIIGSIGMFPTLAAAVIDDSPGMRQTRIVAIMNLAGTIPVIAMSWEHSRSLSSALEIMTDPLVWLMMYGAAAGGWALLRIAPWFAEIIVNMRVANDIRLLEQEQKKLVSEWGRHVTSTALNHPADAIVPSDDGASE